MNQLNINSLKDNQEDTTNQDTQQQQLSPSQQIAQSSLNRPRLGGMDKIHIPNVQTQTEQTCIQDNFDQNEFTQKNDEMQEINSEKDGITENFNEQLPADNVNDLDTNYDQVKQNDQLKDKIDEADDDEGDEEQDEAISENNDDILENQQNQNNYQENIYNKTGEYTQNQNENRKIIHDSDINEENNINNPLNENYYINNYHEPNQGHEENNMIEQNISNIHNLQIQFKDPNLEEQGDNQYEYYHEDGDIQYQNQPFFSKFQENQEESKQFNNSKSNFNSMNAQQMNVLENKQSINQNNFQGNQFQDNQQQFNLGGTHHPQEPQRNNSFSLPDHIKQIKLQIIDNDVLIKENKKQKLQIDILQEEIKNLKVQNENVLEQEKKYKQELSNKNNEIFKYKQEISALEGQLKQSNLKIKQSKSEIKSQNNQIMEELRQKVREQQDEIDKKTKRIIELTKSLEIQSKAQQASSQKEEVNQTIQNNYDSEQELNFDDDSEDKNQDSKLLSNQPQEFMIVKDKQMQENVSGDKKKQLNQQTQNQENKIKSLKQQKKHVQFQESVELIQEEKAKQATNVNHEIIIQNNNDNYEQIVKKLKHNEDILTESQQKMVNISQVLQKTNENISYQGSNIINLITKQDELLGIAQKQQGNQQNNKISAELLFESVKQQQKTIQSIMESQLQAFQANLLKEQENLIYKMSQKFQDDIQKFISKSEIYSNPPPSSIEQYQIQEYNQTFFQEIQNEYENPISPANGSFIHDVQDNEQNAQVAIEVEINQQQQQQQVINNNIAAYTQYQENENLESNKMKYEDKIENQTENQVQQIIQQESLLQNTINNQEEQPQQIQQIEQPTEQLKEILLNYQELIINNHSLNQLIQENIIEIQQDSHKKEEIKQEIISSQIQDSIQTAKQENQKVKIEKQNNLNVTKKQKENSQKVKLINFNLNQNETKQVKEKKERKLKEKQEQKCLIQDQQLKESIQKQSKSKTVVDNNKTNILNQKQSSNSQLRNEKKILKNENQLGKSQIKNEEKQIQTNSISQNQKNIYDSIDDDDIKIKKKPKKSMSTIDEIIKKYNYQADLLSDQSTKTQQNDQNFQHQETTNLNNKFIVANQINQEQQQDKEEDDEDYDYDLDLKQLSQLVATKKNQILKEESTRQQQNFTLSNNLQEKKIQVKQPSIITFPKESKLLQLINPTQTFQQQTNNLNANQSLFGLQSTPQSNINPQFTQSLNNEVFKDQNFEVSIRQTELSDQQSINNQSFDKINLDSSFNSQYSPREPSSPASSQKSSRSSYQYTIPIVHTNQEYLNRNFLQQLQAKGVKIFLQEELSIQEYSGNYYKIFNNHYEILKSLSKDQLQILTNIVQELVIKDVLLTLKYSQFKECATAISVQDDYNIFCQYFLNRENLPYMEKSYSYLFQKKNIKKKEQMLLAFDPFSCNRRQRFLIIFSLILMYYKICNLEVKILELLEYSVKGGVNYDFIYIFTNIYPQIYLPVGLNKTYENKKKVYQISEKEITKLIYLKEYYQFNISDVHYQILDKQININNDSQKMKPQNKQFDKQKQKTTENIIQNIFQNSDQIQIEEKIDKSHSESQEFQSKNYNNLSEYSCLIQTLRLIIIIVIYQEYMRCQSYQQRIKIHQQLQLIESYLRLNTDKSKVDEVILKQINQNDVTKRLQEEVLGYKKNYMFFLKSNQNSFEEDMIMNFMLRYYIIFGDFQLQKWVKSQADFFIHFNYYDFIGSFNLLTEFIKQTNLNIAEKVYLNVLKGYFTNPKYCYTILKTLQIVNIYKITKIISNQNSIIEIRHNFQKILEGSSNNTQKQYEFQDIDSQIVQNFFL